MECKWVKLILSTFYYRKLAQRNINQIKGTPQLHITQYLLRDRGGGGVKNTVGTIRTNVKQAFFKPLFRYFMLNRST